MEASIVTTDGDSMAQKGEGMSARYQSPMYPSSSMAGSEMVHSVQQAG